MAAKRERMPALTPLILAAGVAAWMLATHGGTLEHPPLPPPAEHAAENPRVIPAAAARPAASPAAALSLPAPPPVGPGAVTVPTALPSESRAIEPLRPARLTAAAPPPRPVPAARPADATPAPKQIEPLRPPRRAASAPAVTPLRAAPKPTVPSPGQARPPHPDPLPPAGGEDGAGPVRPLPGGEEGRDEGDVSGLADLAHAAAIAPGADPVPGLDPGIVADGRALLRILERGAGPAVEIAWPDASDERERLYRTLARCLGMRIALLDGRGRLFRAEGPRGTPWTPDSDRYSGFVRRPEGRAIAAEAAEAARIRGHHRMPLDARPVRLFPRQVDAVLIGGLRQAVGPGYLEAKSIRAVYRHAGTRVVVDSIAADGRPVAGRIDISAGARCADGNV